MNDLQILNLMMARGAKLDDIITAITGEGGTVDSPQKVTEIVNAINDVGNWDADLTPSNLRKNIQVFDKIGTLEPWQTASGTVISGSSTLPFTRSNGTSVAWYYITVSGIAFTPKVVIITTTAENSAVFYSEHLLGYDSDAKILLGKGDGGGGLGYIFKLTGNAYVNTGFRLPVLNQSISYNWYAKG